MELGKRLHNKGLVKWSNSTNLFCGKKDTTGKISQDQSVDIRHTRVFFCLSLINMLGAWGGGWGILVPVFKKTMNESCLMASALWC